MDIAALHAEYAAGRQQPEDVVNEIFDRIQSEGLRPVWISLAPREQAVARARAVAQIDATTLPLFGVPFAVKDNFDVAGMETTAACPAYAHVANETATVVQKLEQAGAILIGKTNMDQFATGLVGTRSPYGACSTVFDARYISGGSSSGSAVAVASGLVSFALGTDTAGSGRVPAMFNNLIGLKPTRGVLSTHGVVPACRTLDCVSMFTETAHDAALVLRIAQGLDPKDPYSRQPAAGDGAAPWSTTLSFRFGVPAANGLQFFGDELNPPLYRAAVDALIALGGELVELDYAPLLEVAQMLYKGPWVAERYTVVQELLDSDPGKLDPTIATIIEKAKNFSAADTFRAAYALEELRGTMKALWGGVDILLLPTAPRTYTHLEIAEAPLERNSHLGHYTNFVNLLDLAAVALPAGLRPDGLPFGVSLIGQAFTDPALLQLADGLHRKLAIKVGGSQRLLADTPRLNALQPPHGCLLMAVVGAHLTGEPLNWQLTQRGGRLVRTCRTSENYRFYALKGTTPPKPGLLRVPGFKGPGIEIEVWALPANTVGTFVDGVPPPLSIGTLILDDGTLVMGFLVEPAAIEDAVEITGFGGWRVYLKSLETGVATMT
jgi:allophanate hydrolase